MQNDSTTINDLIWLLEDDDRQAATLERDLVKNYARLSKDKVIRIPTEAEFLQKLKEVFDDETAQRPRLVIADVMLPWAFLGKEPQGVERPADVNTTHGFRTAGARCWDALRAKERAANVRRTPFVFHTALSAEEFDYPRYSDKNTQYIPKDQSFERLQAAIKEVTDLHEEWSDANWPESEEKVSQQLLADPEMKQILFEGLQTPLKACVPFPA
jgi:CheY-like chemotaxis protein